MPEPPDFDQIARDVLTQSLYAPIVGAAMAPYELLSNVIVEQLRLVYWQGFKDGNDSAEGSAVLQAVLDAISGTLDPSTQIADHPNVKFAQMQRLDCLDRALRTLDR
jgi:hypothetical protein